MLRNEIQANEMDVSSVLRHLVRRPRPCLRAAVALALLAIPGIGAAQTLTDPTPKAAPQQPKATKSHSAAKACSQYGAGFVQVAGTDTCVKIGGFVTVEGGR